MIPPKIAEAADAGGWQTRSVWQGLRGNWVSILRGGQQVDIRRDRWRHTTARAYRGNALSAILRGQAAIAAYLEIEEPSS